MSLLDQWSPTNVQVTVLQARGLRIKGKHGTNDAYALMQLGKDKFQTSVAEKSVAPVWKEEATFDMPTTAQRDTLHVHVLHRALVGPDKLLGQAVISLLQLHDDKGRDKTQWHKLLDKSGKPDKDRGELLVDIQFTRNNLTASMFDISAAGKSRSRLGKFKDKVRGKKKEEQLSETPSSTGPAVMTDSEDEGGSGGEGAPAEGGQKKKKSKVKSLFSHKTNLQKSFSQSMSVLPGKNSSLSGSRSSDLNVEAPEGKKKFKFLGHKRTASSDKKEQKLAEQSNLCINGSHVYCEEPAPRTSRASSNFSLASSGVGSMDDVPDSSPPSVGSRGSVRRSSPWTEEEEETVVEDTLQVDEEVLRGREVEELAEEEEEEDERRHREEEERQRGEEERQESEEQARQEKIRMDRQRLEEEEEERQAVEMRRAEEDRKKKEEEERIEEEEQSRRELEEREREREEEEKIRRQEEEERQRRAEELEAEEKRREEEMEELRKLEEESRRRQRVLEEEMKKQEEQRRRDEMLRIEREREEERKMEEERKEMEEEEKMREEEEEQRRLEEEREERRQQALWQEQERIRREEEVKERLERERAEEEMRRIQREREEEEYERLRKLEEEELSRQMEQEQRRKREEELERERLAEEERRRGEKKRQEEEEYERLRKLEEEELSRQMEQEQRRKREEELERERLAEEERRREEERKREEDMRQEAKRRQEEIKKREEEEKTRREEEKRRQEEKERALAEAQRHSKTALGQKHGSGVTSTNPFDENDEDDPTEEGAPRAGRATSARQRCKVPGERSASASGDVSAAQEKRPAPKPPRMNSSGRQQEAQLEPQVTQQSKDKDIKTASVPPQRSAEQTRAPSPSSHSKTNHRPEHLPRTATSSGRRPAPLRPGSAEGEHLSKFPLVKAKGAPAVSNLNPFEDDVDEFADDDEAPASATEPPSPRQSAGSDAAASIRIKSPKTAHAPAPPPIAADPPGIEVGREATASDIGLKKDCAPIQQTSTNGSQEDPEEAAKDAPPVPSRRLLPVKPLNPQDQGPDLSLPGETDEKPAGEISRLKDNVKATGPYALLTQEELISLVNKQESQLAEKSKKISELEQYIDNLLVRVIEEAPSVLMTITPLK